MKKNYPSVVNRILLSTCLVLQFLLLGSKTSMAAVAAGDIAIIGHNCDPSTSLSKTFAIVTLADIAASEVIYFSDKAYYANAFASLLGNGSEGIFSWTIPAGGVAKGTVIMFTVTSSATSPSVTTTPSTGTTSVLAGWTSTSSTVSPFGQNGDNILIYQGTEASPTFIFGYNSGNNTTTVVNGWNTGLAINPNGACELPSSLTVGTNAIGFNGVSGYSNFDNLRYNGTQTGTKAALLTAICTASNWIHDNDTNSYDLTPGTGVFTGSQPIFTIGSGNIAPLFLNSSPQSLNVCQNASATSLISLLHVNDASSSQTITWTQQSGPTNGILTITSATASSGSTDITPGGTITYTPTNGYNGTDQFTIRVSDGIATADMVINVTVNALPTITLGSNPSICNGITSANLTYSATANSPNQYSIAWSAGGIIAGFTNLSNTSLPASPIVLTAPSNPGAGTYNGNLRVINSTTGCSSTNTTISVTVNALPTITLGSNPSICNGTTSANLTYSATTSSPNQYNISWSAGAIIAGFTNISNTPLPASPFVLTAPSNPGAGTYAGTLRVVNSTTGCSSTGSLMSVTVNALPTITLGTVANVNTTATSFSLPYSATTSSPNQYSISTGSPTAMPSFSAVTNASLSASPISVTIPASAANTYNFVATVKNSTTGCSSANNNFALTVAAASTINTTGTLSAFTSCAGVVSSEQSFAVSGSGLSADITITPPTGFEVSTTSGSGFGSSVTLTQSSGSVANTTIYVRLSTAAIGSPSGNIVCASSGATSQNIAASGTVSAAITGNNFTSSQTICSGATPTSFTGSTPTGGTGSFSYLWLSSTTSNSAGFSPASGTNNAKDYSPGATTQSTWYKRVVSSGTCNNDTSLLTTTGVYALSFNGSVANGGSSGYLSIAGGTPAAIQGTGNKYVGMWVYPTSTNTGGLLNFGNSGACYATVRLILVGGFLKIDQGCGTVTTSISVPQNQWTYVFMSFNSSTQYTIGKVSGGTVTKQNVLTSTSASHGAGAFNIGANTINGNYFTGQMDEVSIWSKNPTDAEIVSMSQNGLTGSEASLVGYWNFNAGPGNSTVTDNSGHSLTGTLTNINTTSGWVSSTLTLASPTTITVNPVPSVSTATTAAICSGTSPNISLTASLPSSFAWTLGTNTGAITGASASNGSTINQTLTNPSNSTAGSIVYTVTPTATSGSCVGSPTDITVTVNPKPTITLGTVANVNTTATSFSLPYSATTGSPDQYSITTGTTAMPSFSAVSNASLPASPISVTIPASAANTYDFVASVKNSTTGCTSVNNNFTVTTASGIAISSITRGTPSGAITNASSVTYNISFGASVTGLSASNFSLSTTGTITGASVGTLSGSGANYTLTVNTGTGSGSLTLNLANSTGISPSISTTLPFAGETYTIDKTIPTVVTQNRTLYLNAAGTGSLTAAQVNNGSSDASGIASLSINTSNFTCANIGANTVTLTVTDSVGNTNTGTATITVSDTVRPVAVTRNRTLYLSAAGTGTVTPGQVNNGSTDACGVAAFSLSQTSFTCANVGTPVTVTFTVTDVSGNTGTGTATVTVLDTVRPVVVTQNRTVYLSAAGTATVSALQLNNGTSDACGVASLSASQTSYTCANVGTPVTVTLTATDLNGNTNTGTATVTVLDTIRPVVNTQNRTVYLSAAGTATVSALQLNNGTSDACGVASLSASQTSYTCANVGTPVTVTLTATDLNGNTNTGTATVTVLDTVRPVVNTQNRTVYLSAAGTATVSALQLNNGTSDACGVASLSASQTSYTCANVGTPVTVTLTATDLNGNTNTGTATVTVLDTIRPVVNTQNRTVYLSAAGTATVSALQLNNGTSDACGVASLSASQTSYTCANVGTPVTVTLTATDLNGNTNTGTATVTVLDTIRPVVVTQNRTITLNDAGTATVSALQINNGTSDACGVASLSLSQTSFTTANLGANTVTLTATDLNGNTNTGNATVTVIGSANANLSNLVLGSGTLSPTFDSTVIAYTASVVNATSSITVTPTKVQAGATIEVRVNSGTYAAVTSGSPSGSLALNVGSNTIDVRVTAQNGTTQKTYTVTVTRASGIAISSVLRGTPIGSKTNASSVTYNISFGASVTGLSASNFSLSTTGTITGASVGTLSGSGANYTLTVNTGTGSGSLTLNLANSTGISPSISTTLPFAGETYTIDKTIPTVVTQNRTLYLNAAGTGSLTAAQVNNGSSDASGIASLSINTSNFTCANIGANTVTLTVTDSVGNTNTGTATITVSDTVRPVAVTRNRTLYLSAAGTGTVTPGQVNNGSTDACGVAAFSLSQTSFTCANVGTPVTVTFTVTDVSGNTGTGTATVTVLDTVRPVVVTQNRTVYLSAAGTATVSALQLNNGTSDACGVASLSASQTSYTCANVGTPVTVTLTATDLNGNTNTGTATVTVLDTIRPVVNTQNRTVYLSAAGTATVSALQLNNGTSDACGVASLSASQTSYTCANVGTPVTVTLTATDLNGNTNTGTATVTVLDTVRPVVNTQNRTVYLSAAGTATVSALQLNNGTSDACGVASLSASQTSYTCANVGTPVTVTLTATDLNGNTNTGTATVTVLDTIRPVVNTQNRTVYLSAAGTATVSALQLNNGTSDACGVASLSASQTSYTCANVGTPVTVTLTATDLNGNTNTGTATVTVLDTIRPVVNTQNRTVYLSAAGTATVSALQLNNGTSDACGVASLSASQTSYTCANVGTPVTVTLTATDLNGNTNTGTATVTVLDTIRPVVNTQNRTVYLSAAGTATVSALQLNNGTSDACGVASLSASQTSYTCANVGTPVTVTLTATDLNGNTNTGTATVTVLDTVRPVVNTQNRTVYLSAAGTATVSALQLNNGTSDACGVASLSASQTSYTCANVGTPVTVTLTATDLNGNTNTGTATVTVLDTVRPVVVTQNRTITLSDAGTATISAGQVNNGSTDACGVAALSLSQTSFTSANIGANNVTLTVTDVNGNTNTGTATVTVNGSANANLSNLVLGSGTLSPTFDSTVIAYTASVVNATSSITVTPTKVQAGATIEVRVNSGTYAAVTSGSPSGSLALNVGSNTIDVRVTAQNGTTQKTYTVTVTRASGAAISSIFRGTPSGAITNASSVTYNISFGASVTGLSASNFSLSTTGTITGASVGTLSGSGANYTLTVNTGTGSGSLTLNLANSTGISPSISTTLPFAGETYTIDKTIPTVVTQNRTVYLNAAGTGSLTAAQVNNGSSDASGIASLSINTSNFTCANIGANTVTLTVTDSVGNTNTGTATITVLDTVRPVAVTRNRTLYLSAAGTGTVTPGQVNNGSTDACGVAAFSLSQTSFTCANVGTPVTVTFTVTDVSGNTGTGTATVTVLDTVRPVVVTQNRTIYLSAAGTATVSALQLNNGTSDACGVASLSASQTSFTCANVGTPVTVTLTATDLNGNTNTGTATVTVLDTIRPVVNTQNRTVYLSAAGTATVSALQLNNGTSDACGVASLSASQTSYTCANVGTPVTVTLTATDLNGNTNTGTATVTVLDTIRPVVNTQNRTVYLSAAGTATVSALQLNNGTSDACGVASLSASQTSYTCANVGTPVTVTLTATDLNGNTNTGTATVTVLDTIRPVVNTQNRTVYLSAAGTATVSALQLNNGTSDACGVASLSASQTSFTCANVGTPVTVTLTATDLNGNTNTGTATVTVLDTVRPVVVTQNRTVYLSAAGTATVSALQLNNGTSDACGVASLSASQTSFTCANVGTPVTVTLTATDLNGNTNTGTATVTVLDTIRPVVNTQNRTVYLSAAGTATVSALQLNNGTSDACGVASLSASQTSFTCANVGTPVTVTLTATDLNGNTNTGTATVTVLDTVRPVVNTQNRTVYLSAAGTATVSALQLNNGTSDACGVASLSASQTSYTCANVGTPVTVTLTATDLNGNTNTGTATVTVLDTVRPVVVTQNRTVYLSAAGTATVSALQLNNGTSDACGVASLSASQTSYTCANVGTPVTVTLTATDLNGNTNTGTATVTVLDTVRPVVVTQNRTVYLSAAGTATVSALQLNNGTSDACGVASLSASQTSYTCANVGTPVTVTLTATDLNGNTNTGTATVTVLDTIRPVVNTQNRTVYLSAAGTATVSALQLNNGTSDACGVASLSASQTSYTCANVGTPVTVTLTATDLNGNTNTGTATVTVLDTVRPVVNTQNRTVYLSAAGTASLSAGQVNNGSTDACGVAALSLSQTSFTCANVGTPVTVTLTATDLNGNTNTGTATVTVLDTIRPVVNTQNRTVYLSAAGTATVSALQLNNGTSDACGVASLSASQTSYTCANVGTPVTVTLTATDLNGNTNTGTATVTVLDTVRPVVNTQNRTVYLSAAGTATVSALQLNNGTSDACGVASLSASQTSFTCANVGTPVTVTLTATDLNGNTNTGTATVTVLDTIRPVVVCKVDTIILDGTGNGSTTAIRLTQSATDNCSIVSSSISKSTFNTTNIGNNSVVLSVTDIGGNISSCTTTVVVIEPKPVAICQNKTIYLNASGTATLVVNDVDNGSYSLVGLSNRTISKSAFTCADLGANSVKLVVTNIFNTSDSCTATVTVLDTIKPTVIKQNITAYLSANGTASVTAASVNNGSIDNCSISTLSLSKTSFDCSNLGGNSVWFIVTDNSGNKDSVQATVTVLDTIKPTIQSKSNVVLYLTSNGTLPITSSVLDNGSYDNCDVDSIYLSQPMVSCSDLGVKKLALTVVDQSNNSTTDSVSVVVLDPIAPIARPKSKVVVYLSTNGQAVINPSLIDSASTDNCTITGRILSQTVFTCGQIGLNSVTFTVQDQSGNSSFATAQVEVRDTIKPNVIVSNQTLYLNGAGTATTNALLVNNNSTDNCGIDSVWISKTNFTCSDVGTGNMSLFVRDVNGNVNSAVVSVTVFDTIRPMVRAKQGIVAYLNASGSAIITANQVDSLSGDNCSLASLSVNKTNFTCSDLGNNTLTLQGTDVNGNNNSYSFNVLVRDTIKPSLTVASATVYLTSTGIASVSTQSLVSSSTDNCGTPVITANTTSFSCANRGANTVVVTATDASGNSVIANTTVTVLDTIKPTVLARNITAYLNASGNVSITTTQVNNGSIDNCGIVSYSLSKTNFTGADLGVNTVSLSAIDASGNSNSSSFTITIVDTVRPLALAQNVSVYLNAAGTASITAGTVNNGSSDNVGVSTLSVSKTTFTCSDIGSNSIVLTVTDASNNSSTVSTTVMVYDTIKPVALGQNITTYLNGIGIATITPSQVNNNSSDNCTVSSTTLSKTSFTCDNKGANTVLLTATDASGNTSSTNVTVTVLDTIKPNVVVNNNLNLYLNALGTVGLSTLQVNNGSSDNCTIASLALSQTSFNASELGLRTVLFTVTDASGNSSSVTVNVTVLDTVRPVVSTINKTIYLNQAGQASVSAIEINNGSTDNVGVVGLALSKYTYNCSELGVNAITFQATDASGNIGSGIVQITVVDTIKPQLLIEPGNLVFGKCGSKVNFSVPPIIDNCGQYTVTQTAGIPNGGIYPVGTTVNTFTITDLSGNSITTSFSVTILPSYLPVTFTNLEMCSNADVVDLTQGKDSLVFEGSGVLGDGITFDPRVSGAGNHVINYTFTDSMGCANEGSFMITVFSSPETPAVDRVNSTTLKVREVFDNYQWYYNNQPFVGQTKQTINIERSGIYYVVVKNNKGCAAISVPIGIGVQVGLGVIEDKANFMVYPNPNSGRFTLEYNKPVTVKEPARVIITDLLGKEIYQTEVSTAIMDIDLSEIAPGTYYVRMIQGDAVTVKPIVIKN